MSAQRILAHLTVALVFACTLAQAHGEDFAVPHGRFDVLLFFGERGPKPFHRLKPLSFAQAGHLLFQFKSAH